MTSNSVGNGYAAGWVGSLDNFSSNLNHSNDCTESPLNSYKSLPQPQPPVYSNPWVVGTNAPPTLLPKLHGISGPEITPVLKQ